MNRVPDRKRLRREYLRKQVLGHGKGGFGVLFYVLGSLLCPVSGCIAVLLLLGATLMLSPWCLITALAFAGMAVATWKLASCAWRLLDGFEDAARTPYVPPVTTSTLPVEEVLVRGAAEPSTPSETLLRAAGTGEETKAEELLRSSQGG